MNKRAVSVSELLTMRHKVMEFSDEWEASFGQPERSGAWLIWGASGQGKTRFALQLCKYLTRYGRVAYNSLEEGASRSMRLAIEETRMEDVSRKFILLDQEPIEELKKRLDKHKSPDIIVIDSVQYTGLNYKEYKELRYGYKHKLFILVSHADGKEPAGRVARSIKFDSFIKIRVEGYRAFPISRYGGGEHFDIWPEKAYDYWGLND